MIDPQSACVCDCAVVAAAAMLTVRMLWRSIQTVFLCARLERQVVIRSQLFLPPGAEKHRRLLCNFAPELQHNSAQVMQSFLYETDRRGEEGGAVNKFLSAKGVKLFTRDVNSLF